MYFFGLPGGSSPGDEGDPGVFGRTFVVLFWLFVAGIVGAFFAAIFYAASLIDPVN